ncbi:MAG: hypothetical protein LBB73_05275 [Dysgonamonadaceae bacterium]|nr:hypothetical protein [Dysgonamonadaceae bacterium]
MHCPDHQVRVLIIGGAHAGAPLRLAPSISTGSTLIIGDSRFRGNDGLGGEALLE